MSQDVSSTDGETPWTATSMDLRRLPGPLKWGLGLGLVGFLITFQSTATSSRNGVVESCESVDLAAFFWAVACVGCAVTGIGAHRAVRRQERDATRVMVVVTVAVLLLLAVVHVLRGLAILNSPC